LHLTALGTRYTYRLRGEYFTGINVLCGIDHFLIESKKAKAGRGMLPRPQGFSHDLKIAAASNVWDEVTNPVLRAGSMPVHSFTSMWLDSLRALAGPASLPE